MLTGGLPIPIYDGVVTIEDDDIQVILGLEEDKIRLSSGGLEIGEWAIEDCSIDPSEDGSFTITAEDETLRFVPNNPVNFAAAMNHGRLPDPIPTSDEDDIQIVVNDTDELPDPKPLTKAAFYALIGVTAALGIWALVSIIV